MYRIQIKQNYRLECQGAAKVSVLYFIQTDFYYVFVLIASTFSHRLSTQIIHTTIKGNIYE